ncbi:MAG TPA: 23S rRNA (guanosine(2251)-2'-O)-methyltransferase RlmB, partial [Dehalococcoidia bacterium]|nr:23S rRNA (guanosine(2251)-2'-O)-methyltransferase RlmB [Dehalococcoidia bacterium]
TAKNKKIPISIIEHNNFQRQFGSKSGQNIVATISLTFLKSIDDLIINNNENSKVLIVDKVQDPRNLGALIRSAESAGFEAIILSSNNAAKINSTVVESSSGAISHIPIIDDQNINQIIKKLKDNNYWIIGLDMDGDKEYEDYDFYGNIALVIGSEGSGISKLTKSLCDQIYKISMKGKTESLNVSVAGGIMMFKISNS